MYKPTLFDRYGADAGTFLRAFGYGLMVFGLSIPLFVVVNVKAGFVSGWWAVPWVLLCAGATGATVALCGIGFVHAVGESWKMLIVNGSSTPYREQYSYQQALVMQGKVDEALASFEAVIAEKPGEIDPRMKAAELYAREKSDHKRAAALFREVQRIATVAPGDDIYVTNRLVDLLVGPLDDPGRALVELRRLVDRYPGSAAAVHARDALTALKARMSGA